MVFVVFVICHHETCMNTRPESNRRMEVATILAYNCWREGSRQNVPHIMQHQKTRGYTHTHIKHREEKNICPGKEPTQKTYMLLRTQKKNTHTEEKHLSGKETYTCYLTLAEWYYGFFDGSLRASSPPWLCALTLVPLFWYDSFSEGHRSCC